MEHSCLDEAHVFVRETSCICQNFYNIHLSDSSMHLSDSCMNLSAAVCICQNLEVSKNFLYWLLPESVLSNYALSEWNY